MRSEKEIRDKIRELYDKYGIGVTASAWDVETFSLMTETLEWVLGECDEL